MTDTETTKDRHFGSDTVPPEWEYLVGAAKSIKDGRVAGAGATDPEGACDITPHVAFFRGGELIAQAFCPNVSRDEGLDLVRMGLGVYDADRFDLFIDAHHTDESFYKKYGRHPDPHELQNLCDNEGACDIGLTTDCILALRGERSGPVDNRKIRLVWVTLPYHVDRRFEVLEPKVAKAITGDERDHIKREGKTYTRVTRTVHWMDDKLTWADDADGGLKMEGFVPDALRFSLAQPGVRAEMDKVVAEMGTSIDDFGLTEYQAQLHQDIAGCRFLAEMGFGVMQAFSNEEDAAVAQQSLSRSPGLTLLTPEGEVLVAEPEPDGPLDIMSILTSIELGERRKEMEARRQKDHEDELAITAARKAAREANGGRPTADDVARFEASHRGESED